MRSFAGDNNEVEVRAYIAPPGSGAAVPSNPLSAFSDRAQAAYVTAMASRIKDASALRNAIFKSTEDGPAPDSLATIDSEKRLLILTVTRPTRFAPGDRIMRLAVRVQPLNFTFGGYTVAQTDRETVDITTLNRTSTNTGSVSLTAAAGAPVGGTASLESKREIGTSTKLTEAPEKLTVDMVPSCMRVVQESAHSVDITGNIRIAISLLTRAEPHVQDCTVENSENVGTKTSTPMMDEVFVANPALAFKGGRPDLGQGKSVGSLHAYPHEPLIARVTWSYVLRHIDSGAASYDEGEQGVSLVNGSNDDCQPILTRGQFLPPLYAIYESARAPRNGEAVQIGRGKNDLVFTTLAAAEAAASWVNTTQPSSLGALPILYDKGFPVGAHGYEIKGNDTACEDQDFMKKKRARALKAAGAKP